MKTALYGIVCFLAGVLLQKFYLDWPFPFRLLASIGIGFSIVVVAYFIEAMTISKFVWGEDRYER